MAPVAGSATGIMPAILANPTAVAALAGGGIILAGIAGVVYFMDQRNQRLHMEKILEDRRLHLEKILGDQLQLVLKLVESGDFIVRRISKERHQSNDTTKWHNFTQVEFHDSGVIKKITPFHALPEGA